jgi:hypothetical protein
MPSIEEAATSLVAPYHPTIPKKKRKPAKRRILKKAEATAVAQALQQALKLSKEIEVPASSLVSKDASAVAIEVIQAAKDLQNHVVSEAEDLLLIANSAGGNQKVSDVKPAEVVNVSSDSSSLSLSSSSDSDDDKPLGQRYPKLVKSHPTSTKTYKKPSQTSSYEHVGHVIDQKLEEFSERRNQYIDRILRHHPQPLNIQPLNIIVPDEFNLNSEQAPETASEAVASDKVVSDSPQQHTPEPQKTSSPQQQPTNTHIDP